GAVISAADDSAVAATNSRRDRFLRGIGFPLSAEPNVAPFLLSVVRHAGLDGARAEILFPRSEQNWRRLSRKHRPQWSRTNVVCDLMAGGAAGFAAVSAGEHVALHTSVSVKSRARNRAAARAAVRITRSCRKPFLIRDSQG